MIKEKVLGWVLLTGLSCSAQAVPDLTRQVEYSWDQQPSSLYQFERYTLSSADGERRYRVTLAKPRAAKPEQGYPVLYTLDGNAVLNALDDSILAAMSGGDWPVVVAIGYDTELYFDTQARSFDYTFTSAQSPEDGRIYGGAESFWQLLESRVKPLVQSRVSLDPTRQTLWGHSFGGLFVLHVLFNHPNSYQGYVAADPSLWWQDGLILKHEQLATQSSEHSLIRVALQRSSSRRSTDTLPEDATRQLALRLSAWHSLQVEYHEYFAHNHGSLLAASLPEALRISQLVGSLADTARKQRESLHL